MASPWGYLGACSAGAQCRSEAGSTHAGSCSQSQAQLFSPSAQPRQQQPNVPKAWLSPTRVCPSQARAEHPCVPPSQEAALSLSTLRPSCASTESSSRLSPGKWRRLEAGGEGKEGVRGWSSSSSPFSLQLLPISHAPFQSQECQTLLLCFGEAMSRTEAGFQLGMGWPGGKINSLIDIQGWEWSCLLLAPSALTPAAPQWKWEEAKGVTGTKRDKQRIIFQATIHHLKPKQRNNFPSSTAFKQMD